MSEKQYLKSLTVVSAMTDVALNGNRLMEKYNIPQDELLNHEKLINEAYVLHKVLTNDHDPQESISFWKKLFRK